METRRRSLTKALSWQLLGVIASTLVGTGFTGDPTGALRLALALALTGFALYVLHERAWARVRWGIATGSGLHDTGPNAH